MTSTLHVSNDERDALEYVRDLKGFYTHLAFYVGWMVILTAIWLFSGASYPWVIWPALGWGIGVAAHGLSVTETFSMFSASWEQRQVARRLATKRRESGS